MGGIKCQSAHTKLISIFKSEKLGITVDPVSQVTDYLDVKFNLATHTHEPYRIPGNIPIYLHVDSNHPKHVIRHIPQMIERRISKLSSNEEIFNQHKGIYEKSLHDSGHKANYTKNQLQ